MASADDDNDEGDQTPPAGTPVDRDELRNVVREVLVEVLGDGTDDEPPAGDEGSEAGGSGGAPASPRAVEADMESQVRKAMAKLAKEDELDKRVSKIEKVVEAAPRAFKKVTTFMWGGEK